MANNAVARTIINRVMKGECPVCVQPLFLGGEPVAKVDKVRVSFEGVDVLVCARHIKKGVGEGIKK